MNTTILTTAMTREPRRRARPDVMRIALVGLTALYLGVVLVLPLAALVLETVTVGASAAWAAVSEPEALSALSTTASLVVIAVAVNAVVGVLGALAIVRHRFVGREALSALFDLPLAISPVMIGLAFLLLLGRGGVFAPALDALGIQMVFAFPALVIATLFVTLPYTMREVAYVLAEIGTSEEEAAATLGASPWQIFRHVTFPNIRVALGYGLLMTVARTLGEFGAVLVLGGSISGRTQTATTFIHDALEERQAAGAYGMAAVLGLVSVALLVALEWTKKRKATR